MAIVLWACGRTDVGRVRTNNEDAWAILDVSTGELLGAGAPAVAFGPGPRGVLLAVCDGVGGAAAGEVASRLALESLSRTVLESAVGSDAAATLRWGVDRANREVWMAAQDRGQAGMATTLVAVLIVGLDASIASVGDSRVYLLRDGALRPLTHDQSYGQLLVDAGRRAGDAHRSRQDNILLQAVGKEPEVVVALGSVGLEDGDRIVVCTDGLWSKLADDDIARVVERAHTLDAACAALVEEANARGGEDNVTVVLAAVAAERPAR